MIPTRQPPRIVLGSTSRYRAELLRRLLADFEQAAPGTDETPLPNEAPAALLLPFALTGRIGPIYAAGLKLRLSLITSAHRFGVASLIERPQTDSTIPTVAGVSGCRSG